MKRVFSDGIAAVTPFVGLFLSLRLNAFIYQVGGISYPSWGHLVVVALCFGVVWLWRARLVEFLNEYAYGLQLPALLVYLPSLPAAYLLRYQLIYSPIEGTDINSPFVLIAVIIGCAVCLAVFFLVVIHALSRVLPALWRRIAGLNRRDWLYLGGLLAVLNLVTYLYIYGSQTVYYWDTAGYWTTTHTLAEVAREGIGRLLRTVYGSVAITDYNYIIALPGAILSMVFGKSRYVFVAGIVNVYLFPLYSLLYIYVRGRFKRPKVLTSALVLFFPCVIYIVLVGFIDVAGVIPCLLAVLLYFRAPKHDLSQYMMVGCLLALAILLRRWYVFFALSFVIAMLVDALLYRRSVTPLLCTVLPMGFILLFFFQQFVSQRILADYGDMYAAYQLGLTQDFFLFSRYFGLVLLILILFVAIYLLVQRDTRPRALFLLVQAISCFVLFVLIQSHGEQHLLLYLPALWLVAAEGFNVLINLEPKPGPILAVGMAVAILPTAGCLIREEPPGIQSVTSPALLPDFSFHPKVRADVDTLLELTAYMDTLVEGTEKQMAVLSSSFLLNETTLTNAEISLNTSGCSEIDRSYVLQTPAVDSRDELPVDLDDWDYVLVAYPPQTHLGEDKQQVVMVPAESFLAGTDIAEAYTLLPETFYFETSGITVSLFERTRPISDDEYQAYLARLEAALPEKFAAEFFGN